MSADRVLQMKKHLIYLLICSAALSACSREAALPAPQQLPGLEGIPLRSSDADEFAMLRFDNDSVLLALPEDSLVYRLDDHEFTFMDRFPVNVHGFSIYMRLLTDTVQQYDSALPILTLTFNNQYYFPHNPMHFDIAEYGAVGDFITIHYAGSMQWDKDSQQIHEVSGTVRFRRRY